MWHAAVIYAAIDDWARAKAELEAGLAADSELAEREEIKKLRHLLGTSK